MTKSCICLSRAVGRIMHRATGLTIQEPAMKRSHVAFTLVELLIIIAIIAIIVSMLLPALQKAREQARRAQCGSNMHQFAIGMVTYGAEERGRLPTTDGQSTYGGAAWGYRTNLFQQFLGHSNMAPTPPTIQRVWGRATWYCPSGPMFRPNMGGPDVESFDWWYTGWDGVGLANYGIATDYNLWWGRAVDDAPYFQYESQTGVSAREAAAHRAEESGKVLSSDMVGTNATYAWMISNHMNHRGSDLPAGGNYSYMDGSVRWWNIERILEDYYLWVLPNTNHNEQVGFVVPTRR